MNFSTPMPSPPDNPDLVDAWFEEYLRWRIEEGFTGQIQTKIAAGKIVRVTEQRVVYDANPQPIDLMADSE